MEKSYYKNVFIYEDNSCTTGTVPGRVGKGFSKLTQAIIDAGYNLTPDISTAEIIYIPQNHPDIDTLRQNTQLKLMHTIK